MHIRYTIQTSMMKQTTLQPILLLCTDLDFQLFLEYDLWSCFDRGQLVTFNP